MASTPDARKLVTAFAKDHKDIPELEFINTNPDGVDINDISGGNGLVNYIYQVRSRDKKQSVILKYGQDTIRTMPDIAISLTRQQLEYNSLVLMDGIEPGSVPTPYCYDSTHNIIAMADVSGWDLLADQLEAGVVDLGVPVYLGHLLAKVHCATSRAAVSAERWEQLTLDFRNDILQKDCHDFTYDMPYIETGRDTKVPAGGLDTYRQYVTTLMGLGLHKKQSKLYYTKLCFIHADLHWKSMFAKGGKAVLFDWEFAFMSHPGQNVGFVVESYLLYHIITQSQARDATSKAALQAQFEQAIRLFLETYMTDQGEAGLVSLSEIALFAGGSTFASSVYCGTELFTNITAAGLLTLMHTGYRLMAQHEALTSVDSIIAAIFNA